MRVLPVFSEQAFVISALNYFALMDHNDLRSGPYC